MRSQSIRRPLLVISCVLAAPVAASAQGTVASSSIPAPLFEVRSGEYEAAPWMDVMGGPVNVGRIVGSSELMGIGGGTQRIYFQQLERIYVVPPAGASQRIGTRFVSFRLAERFEGIGQAVVPTGLLELERAEPGKATVMRVVRQFEDIGPTNGVLVFDSLAMRSGTRPSVVAAGPSTDVLWIKDSPVLPSLGYYIVLRATSRDAVRPGDQFTLMRPAAFGPRGEVLPDEPIAVAQVVRVTARGSTAIVIDVKHGAIKAGVPARLTARMP